MLPCDKVAGGRRPVVRLAMLLLLSASVAAACTSAGDAERSAPEPRPKDLQGYTGPSVQGAAHPIGLKWDWSTLDRYLPFVKDLAGGATFNDARVDVRKA